MATTKPILIIAEKPSLGQAVAAWIAKNKKLPSKSVGRTHIEVGPYRVSWLFGHVLKNGEPHAYDDRYKKWSLPDLPIIPKSWILLPKKEASDQIRVLKELLKEAGEVIGLGDPDQEGQLLQDEFLRWAACKLPVQRLWLPAIDDVSISRAWADMKPNSHYEGYYWSALARSHADWLAGINLSRACTLSSQSNGGNAVLSIGRVQTPTLALIVDLEKQIRTFKPVDYYTPFIMLASTPAFKASWNPDKEKDDRLDAEGRLLDESKAKSIAAACLAAGTAQVTAVKSTKGSEPAPLPFSLSTLQEHMSKRFGMGVQDVLKHAQALYEKKISTYPRTDSEYLPESQFGEAPSVLSGIGPSAKDLSTAYSKANGALKSRAFNDKKVTAHHAIVPRPASSSQLAALSAEERLVWIEIAKRYMLQFFPAAEFLNSEIELQCAGESFRATGKVYTSRGWKDAFVDTEEEDESTEASVTLPKVSKDDVLTVSKAAYSSVRTKPPKRFTEGTLIAAMKNVHRFVSDPKLKSILRENIGIGTEATRSNVVGELFGRKFIVLKKKDICPTELGEQLIDALPKQLTAPDMTALWQQAMDDIRGTGETGYNAFITAQSKWLTDLVKEVPGWFTGKAMTVAGKKASTTIEATAHKCLDCGAEMKRVKGKFGWFFGCQDTSCKAIFKDVDGVPVKKAPASTEVIHAGEHKTGDTCPACKKGTLKTNVCGPQSKSPGKKFLSCSNFFAKGKAKCTFSAWPK